MAAVLVGQFHEFQESTPSLDGNGKEPVITYKLAIGDRVTKLDEDRFVLVQSGVELTREPETQIAS